MFSLPFVPFFLKISFGTFLVSNLTSSERQNSCFFKHYFLIFSALRQRVECELDTVFAVFAPHTHVRKNSIFLKNIMKKYKFYVNYFLGKFRAKK